MLKPDIDWILAQALKIIPPLFVILFLFFLTYRYLYRPDVFFDTDFCNYWIAGSLAMAGEPTAVFDFSRLKAFGEEAGGIHMDIPWFNTPIFLMLLLPLSLVPYHIALFLWLLTTMCGYLVIIRHLAPSAQSIWLALAFPSALFNISYGQSGFLSVIFLGGGLVLLGRSPIVSGIFFGLMTYKPHFALLIPIALAAGRCWETLGAMIMTCGILLAGTVLLFGIDVWGAFFQNIPLILNGLKGGLISTSSTIPLWKMPTVFSAANLLGAGSIVAAVLQTIIGLAVAMLVGRVWKSNASVAIRSAVLVTGTFLITPYSFIYDTVLLSIALACLGWEGYKTGWLPGEKLCLLLGWIAPLFLGAKYCWLLIVPIAMLYIIAIRRMRSETLIT